MTDLEIAQQATLAPITEIAEKAGLAPNDIELFGQYKAKINKNFSKEPFDPNHKLILVTSINPTPAGEGKSTVMVGLGDALSLLDKKTIIAIREPSMGPVMGMKGGATGGGHSQIVPMEDINLHFTGDLHALTSANNTLAALIDNYIHRENELGLDPRRIIWRRALDINDRALRNVVTGLGGVTNGVPREAGFDITAASELMAVLCLSTSIADLKKRVARIVVGYSFTREVITVGQLGFTDAIVILLKDALKPNLVQSLAHTPAIVHGGPFANIAHGCNSVMATKTALSLADFTVTEAGFGSDLGAEKFLDIKTPVLGKHPDCVVVVATIRALKYNGGQKLADLKTEDTAALANGMGNLLRHVANMKKYGYSPVVAINKFVSDTDAEIEMIKHACAKVGTKAITADAWGLGGEGCLDLAKEVVEATGEATTFTPLYDVNDSIENKLNTVVTEIYGGSKVVLTKKARNQVRRLEKEGFANLPICIAKTQYSFSDDPTLLGAPEGFEVTVRELIPKIGAGFIVALTGTILTMPGLPKVPAAVKMTIDDDGKIEGLF